MYQTPLFSGLHKILHDQVSDFSLEVLFGDDLSLKNNFYKEINTTFKPDTPFMLDGYKSIFLKNFTINPKSGFLSRVNLGIIFYLFSRKPDILIIHGYETFTSWLALFIAKILNIKVIWRGEVTLRKETDLKNFFKKKILSLFFSKVNAFFYSCTGNKNFIKSFNIKEDKMFFIPCAVDNNFFQKNFNILKHSRIINRKSLGINNDDFVVLFSARFTQRKRPFDLIKAFSKVDCSKKRLLFVGNGPLLNEMKEMVENLNLDAIFVGWKNQSEISLMYSIANVAVVISEYDPSPKAMNEAMNFSLPIIVTNEVGTSSDLVKDGENGYIINLGDIEELTKKLSLLANDKPFTIKMGKKSQYIINDWNYKKNSEGMYACIKYLTFIKDANDSKKK